jgi:hypothetical protein
MPPQSIEEAKRLKRGSKINANNHQRLSQKTGWVMADSSLDKTNINNLNQIEPDMTSWLHFITAPNGCSLWLITAGPSHCAIGFVL